MTNQPRNRKKIEKWFGAGLLVCLLGAVVYRGIRGTGTVPTTTEAAKAAAPMPPISLQQERSNIPEGASIVGDGIIEPKGRETKLSTSVSGQVTQILVKEGDLVAKGQVLARLDSVREKAAVNVCDADLQNALAELNKIKAGLRQEDVEIALAETKAAAARYALSQSIFQRLQQTTASGGVSVDELDRAHRQAEQDSANLAAATARKKAALAGSRMEDVAIAKAKIAIAEASKSKALADLAKTEITAPYAGEILQIKIREGEFAAAGGAEILVIGDTSQLRARLDIDERHIQRVKLGAHALITVSAFPERRFPGKVIEIARRMGRKNLRTDDPLERIDTKILETVIGLDESRGLVPGLRVVGAIEETRP